MVFLLDDELLILFWDISFYLIISDGVIGWWKGEECFVFGHKYLRYFDYVSIVFK